MNTRPANDFERAWALVVLILLAFIGLGYSLLNGSWGVRVGVAAPEPIVAGAASVSSAGRESAPDPVPAAPPMPRPPARLAFPLPGFEHALRDNFDEKRGLRRHRALDILAPRGTPVRAVDDGRIAKLHRGPLAGIALYQFDADETRVYFYAHLDRYAPGIDEGRLLRRGDLIGYVGSTGNAPAHAPHLHFAMHALGPGKRWWQGQAINPYPLLGSAG